MSDTFVTVQAFDNPFEAQLARNLLENEGIASMLNGELSSGVLVGNRALGGQIVLQVHEDDAPRAAGILASVALDEDWEEQAESGAGVWICSMCGEPVSDQLSVCYACSTPRDGIQAGEPRERTAIQPPPVRGEEIQKRDAITRPPDAPEQKPY